MADSRPYGVNEKQPVWKLFEHEISASVKSEIDISASHGARRGHLV